PAQSFLCRRPEDTGWAGGRRAAVRSRAARRAGADHAAARVPRLPLAPLPEGRQVLPDGRDRLHGRTPPLRRTGGGVAGIRRDSGSPSDPDTPGRGSDGLTAGPPEPRVNVSPDSVPVRIDKPWGYEIWYAWTEHYVGKILHVRHGHRLSLQYHREKDEASYVLRGRLLLTKGPSLDRLTVAEIGEGHVWRNRPGEIHTIEALEDSDVLEVSPPELDDVVRLQDRYGRQGPNGP